MSDYADVAWTSPFGFHATEFAILAIFTYRLLAVHLKWSFHYLALLRLRWQ